MTRLAFIAVAACSLFAQPAATPAGQWLGVIEAGAAKLRLGLNITQGDDGALRLTWDSLDQGARGLPGQITMEGALIKLNLRVATFEGTLNASGDEISGKFQQGGGVAPLNFRKVDRLPEANRPQHPKPPHPYKEEEVGYDSKSPGVRLAGTLTIPPGDGPFPALLLLTGSGPQDRDETIYDHKPFLVLADHLTRRGFAVLRADDRGIGESTGQFVGSTMEDFAQDALGGLEFLKARPEIQKAKIGILGHSEGGIVAPMVAGRVPDIAFLVLLAASAVTGEELLYVQGAELLRAAGASEDTIRKQAEFQKILFRAAREEKDTDAATKRARDGLAAFRSTLRPEERALFGGEEQAEGQIRQTLSRWMRHFLFYDPAPALQKVRCPVLALFGGVDRQVPAGQNAPPLTAALASSGDSDFTVVVLPRLNHLFQAAKTGAVAEYSLIEETVAPVALRTIDEWLERRK